MQYPSSCDPWGGPWPTFSVVPGRVALHVSPRSQTSGLSDFVLCHESFKVSEGRPRQPTRMGRELETWTKNRSFGSGWVETVPPIRRHVSSGQGDPERGPTYASCLPHFEEFACFGLHLGWK